MEFGLALTLALSVNLVIFVVAYQKQTDKLTDATYAATFVLVTLAIYLASPQSNVSIVLLAMVWLWAVRLGLFLAFRIHRIGKDRRFDVMRPHFWRFGRFWLLQGFSVWVILIPSLYLLIESPDSFNLLSIVGLAIWLVGLAVEAVADRQKSLFLANPANKGKWIESGLWSYSRHPNYLGEILVWVGIYLYVVPYLNWAAVIIAVLGPIWITVLLLFISGIPMAEASADKKWSSSASYGAYKKRVPKLIPRTIFFKR